MGTHKIALFFVSPCSFDPWKLWLSWLMTRLINGDGNQFVNELETAQARADAMSLGCGTWVASWGCKWFLSRHAGPAWFFFFWKEHDDKWFLIGFGGALIYDQRFSEYFNLEKSAPHLLDPDLIKPHAVFMPGHGWPGGIMLWTSL